MQLRVGFPVLVQVVLVGMSGTVTAQTSFHTFSAPPPVVFSPPPPAPAPVAAPPASYSRVSSFQPTTVSAPVRQSAAVEPMTTRHISSPMPEERVPARVSPSRPTRQPDEDNGGRGGNNITPERARRPPSPTPRHPVPSFTKSSPTPSYTFTPQIPVRAGIGPVPRSFWGGSGNPASSYTSAVSPPARSYYQPASAGGITGSAAVASALTPFPGQTTGFGYASGSGGPPPGPRPQIVSQILSVPIQPASSSDPSLTYYGAHVAGDGWASNGMSISSMDDGFATPNETQDGPPERIAQTESGASVPVDNTIPVNDSYIPSSGPARSNVSDDGFTVSPSTQASILPSPKQTPDAFASAAPAEQPPLSSSATAGEASNTTVADTFNQSAMTPDNSAPSYAVPDNLDVPVGVSNDGFSDAPSTQTPASFVGQVQKTAGAAWGEVKYGWGRLATFVGVDDGSSAAPTSLLGQVQQTAGAIGTEKDLMDASQESYPDMAMDAATRLITVNLPKLNPQAAVVWSRLKSVVNPIAVKSDIEDESNANAAALDQVGQVAKQMSQPGVTDEGFSQ